MGQGDRGAGPRQWRLSRRRALQKAGLTGIGLGMSAAFACSSNRKQAGGGATPAAQAGKQPKRGGVINYPGGGKIGTSYDIAGRSFDPDIQTQFGAKGYGLFYDRLLSYNLRTYAVEPDLAQKWEQPSQTEYVFHLQPNVKWQNKPPVNGRPLVADDIVWSLERARTPQPQFFSRSLLANVDKIEAPDKATLRITSKSPDVATLTKLSVDNLAIVNREVFEKYPKPVNADGAVGTGAFIVKSVEQNVGAEYIRNPDYWKPGLPYLDSFRTRAFSDPQTDWAAFLAGQVDICPVPGTEVKKYIASRGAGFTPDWYPDDTLVGWFCPNTQAKPMNDARVTRALRLLTDHQEIVKAWAEVLQGRGANSGLLPVALSAYDLTEQEYSTYLEWKQPKDDAAKEAISLLSAAGFNSSNPLKFELITNSGTTLSTLVTLVQAQWKRLSQGVVDAQIKLDDTPTLDSVRSSRQFTYALYGFSAGMAEPGIWLGTTYRSGGSLNFQGFSDPQADAMIDKQETTFDDQQRKAIIKDLAKYMIDHSPTTVGANLYYLNATQPKVQNYIPEHALNGWQYQNVWLSS